MKPLRMSNYVVPQIKHLVKRVLLRLGMFPQNRSIFITDEAIISAFTRDPENTFLVSFPRTGSHWLRMLTELYFERPSLLRVFYYYNRRDYFRNYMLT